MLHILLSTLVVTVMCNDPDDYLKPTHIIEKPKTVNADSFPESNVAIMDSTNDLGDDIVIFGAKDSHILDNDVVFDTLESVKLGTDGNISALSGVEANLTAVNETSVEKNQTQIKVECAPRLLEDGQVPSVNVTNSTVLLKVLTPGPTNVTSADCAVVLFFSSQCVFSARMAPHYNALARVFPAVSFYALDALMHSSVHLRYGIVSVPNILLFHNGKSVARYNDTHMNLENLVNFIVKFTGLQHNGTLNVTSADMNGPVPATLNKSVDYVLILCWVFTIFCLCLLFLKSSLCHRIVESVRNTWLEAEAQHEHVD